MRTYNPEEAYLKKEAAEERKKALTDKQREVYVMYYEYEMPQRVIAGELGISHKAVGARLKTVKSIFEEKPEKFFSVTC